MGMAPTIARPDGRMRVHCRLFVVAFSDVHARGTSFFGTASCMSCFGYFVSWPGLFRFGAAETSFRGILLNDQFPLIHLLVLTLSFTKSVLILGGMQ